MTPKEKDVAALEQWARESLDALDNLDVHGGSAHQHCMTTLALIAAWREGQQGRWSQLRISALERHVTTLTEASDAAVARAAKAERDENDLCARLNAALDAAGVDVGDDGYGAAIAVLAQQRDVARAEVAQAIAARDNVTRQAIRVVSSDMCEHHAAEASTQTFDEFVAMEQGCIRCLRAEVARLTAERDTPAESCVLAFHRWAEDRVKRGARRFTQDEYAAAQEAFYAAHPGDGPHSTLMATPDTLPPLPSGWHRKDSDSSIPYAGFYPGDYAEWAEDGCPVLATELGVLVDNVGQVDPADLIVVLRHAQQAHERMKEGQ